ncbi:hypothetical protein [Gemmatimonas sp. UBA7669]|uniref:hypothetical protein n=1 Tax=Gemmatimonas sp. UBA7669 TaxID=1946568 RepID=UPI0025C0B16E|nr:hypothetical protein [Gemmatimonas sp. UBA7669]
MTAPRAFQARVNPLAFPEVDEPFASIVNQPVSAEAVLRFATGIDVVSDLDSTIARYREISPEPMQLSFAPLDRRVDQKLISPLRAAKAAYMLGTPMATVALSGAVAEMVAVLIWEMAEVTVNGESITTDLELALFGYAFEKLGQERRVSVLKAYGLIPHEAVDDFTQIRLLRKKYLHLWSQDYGSLTVDAVSCYHAAVRLAVRAIGQIGDGGMIALTGAMLRYLERAGHLEDTDFRDSLEQPRREPDSDTAV